MDVETSNFLPAARMNAHGAQALRYTWKEEEKKNSNMFST